MQSIREKGQGAAPLQYSFKRYEKKFLLTEGQLEELLPCLKQRMREECYGLHTICNLYYDTDHFDLIRASLRKPAYKEKFRLRSYGVPDLEDPVFAEIKKKYAGVVYKRRVAAPVGEIQAFLQGHCLAHEDPQIQREIHWFLRTHEIAPRVFIGYERIAFEGIEDEGLRITFDRNIRWRDCELDLCAGMGGAPVLRDDPIVMEIKLVCAMPLWLAGLLSRYRIYPVSFSKYGACYERNIAPVSFRGTVPESADDFGGRRKAVCCRKGAENRITEVENLC